MLSHEVSQSTYQTLSGNDQQIDWACWLAAAVLLQACVVVLQEFIGPSFFLPAKVSS